MTTFDVVKGKRIVYQLEIIPPSEDAHCFGIMFRVPRFSNNVLSLAGYFPVKKGERIAIALAARIAHRKARELKAKVRRDGGQLRKPVYGGGMLWRLK